MHKRALVIAAILVGCLQSIAPAEQTLPFSANENWLFKIEDASGTREATLSLGAIVTAPDSLGTPRRVIQLNFTGASTTQTGALLPSPTSGVQNLAIDQFEFLGARPDGPREYTSLTDPIKRAWQFSNPENSFLAVVEPMLFVPLTAELLGTPLEDRGFSIHEEQDGQHLVWSAGPRALLRAEGGEFHVEWWWDSDSGGRADLVAVASPIGVGRVPIGVVASIQPNAVFPKPESLARTQHAGVLVHHSPAPSVLPSFEGALLAAVDQLLLKASPLPSELLLHRWQRYRNLTTVIGGPLEDPSSTAEALWIFQFVPLPPGAQRWQIDLQEHTSVAGPVFVDSSPPTMVSGPPYQMNGSLDAESLPLTVALDRAEGAHLASTSVERDRIGWAWAFPGLPGAFAYWIQESGCFPDHHDRPSTVTHTSATDGRIRYGFFNEPYSGVNACGIGVTPPFS